MNTTDTKSISKHYAFILLLFMSGLYFISFFQRVAVPGTIFNELQIDFAASAAAVTALSSIYLYVYSGMQLFVGILADKFGGIRTIIVSAILLFIGSIIFPFSDQLWALYMSRALVGLGASAMYLCIIKETDSLFGAKNFSMLLGIFCMIGYGGGLFATKPFRFMVECTGWRVSLVVMALVSLVLLVGVMWMGRRLLAEKHGGGAGRSIIEKLKHVITNRKIYPLMICVTLNFSIYFTVQSTIGTKFIQDFLGLEAAEASKYTFVMMIFTMTMILISGAISRLIGNKRKPFLIAGGFLALGSVVLLICGIIFHLPAGFFMLAYILMALPAGIFPVTAALAKEINSPDTTAIAVAVQNTVCYVVVAIAANIIGKLLDLFKGEAIITEKALIYPASAYMTIFIVMLGLAVISVVFSFFCQETHGKNITMKDAFEAEP